MRDREKIRRAISRKTKRIDSGEVKNSGGDYDNGESLKSFLEDSYSKKVYGRNNSNFNTVQKDYYDTRTNTQKGYLKPKAGNSSVGCIKENVLEPTITKKVSSRKMNEKENLKKPDKEKSKLNLAIMRYNNCIKLLSQPLKPKN